MNEYVQILILAVVQGVAEFLPISSKGHLVIVEQLLATFSGGKSIAPGKQVEVFLHLGTLGSIVVVYARDLWALRKDFRLCAILVVATLPAALIGLAFDDWFDAAFDAPILAGFGLLLTASLLTIAQWLERIPVSERPIPWLGGVVVGCFQAFALLPGVSRSGTTISGGLLVGLDRRAATRFSFLLAVPVTAGAILLTAIRAWDDSSLAVGPGPLVMGVLVAFLVGWASLEALIRIVVRGKLHWFAVYCVIVGLLTIACCLAYQPAGTIQAAASTAGR
jgi:undecaprenyl-diphosphatase